jgi:predicted small secreted protein
VDYDNDNEVAEGKEGDIISYYIIRNCCFRKQELRKRAKRLGQDITSHGHDITSRDLYITSRGQDITSRGQDITSHGQDITPHGQNITSRGQDITSHGQNITSRDLYITSCGQDFTPHGQDITSHGQDITSRDIYIYISRLVVKISRLMVKITSFLVYTSCLVVNKSSLVIKIRTRDRAMTFCYRIASFFIHLSYRSLLLCQGFQYQQSVARVVIVPPTKQKGAFQLLSLFNKSFSFHKQRFVTTKFPL